MFLFSASAAGALSADGVFCADVCARLSGLITAAKMNDAVSNVQFENFICFHLFSSRGKRAIGAPHILIVSITPHQPAGSVQAQPGGGPFFMSISAYPLINLGVIW